MTAHAENSRALLLKTEQEARNEVANLTCRLVASRNKLAAIQRTLDARCPAWRDRQAVAA